MANISLVLGVLAFIGVSLLALRWYRHHVPKGWIIGPIVNGKNYSERMPLRPTATATGWKVAMPVGSQIDAIDRDTGPLPLGGTVSFMLRTINPNGARIVPFETPEGGATVALYFQRKGDNWTAGGKYETYRWYCSPTVDLMQGGGLSVRLVPEEWGAIMSTQGKDNPDAFKAALANASRIGLTFGGPGGRSHGVIADKPVEFELVSFEIKP